MTTIDLAQLTAVHGGNADMNPGTPRMHPPANPHAASRAPACTSTPRPQGAPHPTLQMPACTSPVHPSWAPRGGHSI